MTDITIAILAGGQSQRMGQDKALLTIDGEPLLLRTVRTALAAGAEAVLVIGRERPEDWPAHSVRFLPDSPERAGTGPLGGLATALENAPTEQVILIACDMPALTVEALCWLAAQVSLRDAGTPYGVATTGTDGEPEPLFSLYTRTVLPAILARMESGRRSPRGLIQDGGFTVVSVPEEYRDALINVNTPEELSAYLAALPG